MGLVEKWNNFAKKSIYINNTLEIGCGRLVYSGILFSVSIIWGLLGGATIVQLMPSILFWIRSFKQKEDKDINIVDNN